MSARAKLLGLFLAIALLCLTALLAVGLFGIVIGPQPAAARTGGGARTATLERGARRR